MLKLKLERKREVIQVTVCINPYDRGLLEKLGNCNMGEGLRILLSSVREDLEKTLASIDKKVS